MNWIMSGIGVVIVVLARAVHVTLGLRHRQVAKANRMIENSLREDVK